MFKRAIAFSVVFALFVGASNGAERMPSNVFMTDRMFRAEAMAARAELFRYGVFGRLPSLALIAFLALYVGVIKSQAQETRARWQEFVAAKDDVKNLRRSGRD